MFQNFILYPIYRIIFMNKLFPPSCLRWHISLSTRDFINYWLLWLTGERRVGVSISEERKKVEYLIEKKKKWLSVLFGVRKLSKV